MIVSMKKLKENPLMQILLLLGLIAATILFMAVDARFIAPKRITRRTVTLESFQIPHQLDNVSILFFSDLEYGTFMDESRLDSLIETINNASPDIVLFGGDVYDLQASADEETNALLKEKLGSVNAPLGKFAVLGDNDHRNEDMVNTVTGILTGANFEILNNRSILLHNKDSRSITLVGMDNGLNGMQDIQAAYSNVSPESYVIALCHTPDTASRVPGDLTDYFLAGHSHGGQVYYFFGASYTPAMATEYLRGRHQVGDEFTLDITNGVGTTGIDARFVANCEIVVYRLKSIAPKPTPTPDLTPTQEAEQSPAEEQPAQEQPAEQEVIPETQPEEPASPAEEEPAPAEVPAEQPSEENPEPAEEAPAEENTDNG